MKILSIATVGGQHVKWFLGCLVIIMSVISCDTGYILPLANNKFSYDVSLSEGSMVKVSSMYFKGWYYLIFDLKGEYVINPDSLKLKFCDESIMVGKLLPYSGTDTYNKNNTYVKNRLIAVQLHYKPKAKNQGIDEPIVLFVLPSNFIMKNDKRVITDSLKIVLKRPKKKAVSN